MKQSTFKLLFIILSMIIFSTQFAAAQSPSGKTTSKPKQEPSARPTKIEARKLLGKWECKTEEGTSILEFISENKLEFDGDQKEYRLEKGIVKVHELFGDTDYPYSLNGNRLSITFPEGDVLEFQKIGKEEKTVHVKGKGKKAGSADEYLLKGKFFSYSNVSSTGGSSSWERWVIFDGKGNFTFGSEASHSVNTEEVTGGAYNRDESEENKGTYRVAGDRIIVTFSDGSTDEAEVIERWEDGSIAGFKYQGKSYGSQRE